MISLSATTFDPNGSIAFPGLRVKNPFQGERRGSVTATLDGGAAIYDTGYSVADQTLSAALHRPTRAQLVMLQYLVAYYGEIILCCDTGAFRALLSFQTAGHIASISLRLISRLDT